MSSEERNQLISAAVEDILAPLACLCVAQGLPFAQAEELFKRAYVRAARAARRESGAGGARDVSQVSTATGISRREVARLSADLLPRAVQRPAPATRVFLRWLSDNDLCDDAGRPLPLARNGPAPSFEALALSVTRHVHPRSLLDELCRLGLAELDDAAQQVRLLQDRFVPKQDDKRLYGLLADNVGDHLAAAAANVQHRDRRHFEQAVFADELSAASALKIRSIAQGQWRQLVAAVVPELERLIAEDRAQGRRPSHRARLGMFTYQEPMSEDDHAEPPDTP